MNGYIVQNDHSTFSNDISQFPDQTKEIQNALDSHSSVTISGAIRVDDMITLGARNVLIIGPNSCLARLGTSKSHEPVVWLKGKESTIIGHGFSSVISSDNPSPKGIVRIGHKDFGPDSSIHTTTYCNIQSLKIRGAKRFGQQNGHTDIGIFIPNWQCKGEANYLHSLRNLLLANLNTAICLRGWSNANIISDIHTLHLGNIGLHVHGANGNVVRGWFHHQSPNICQVVLEAIDNRPNGGNHHIPMYNQIDVGGEPGRHSQALEIRGDDCGMIGNQIQIMGNNRGGYPSLHKGDFKKRNWVIIGDKTFHRHTNLDSHNLVNETQLKNSEGNTLHRRLAVELKNDSFKNEFIQVGPLLKSSGIILELRGYLSPNTIRDIVSVEINADLEVAIKRTFSMNNHLKFQVNDDMLLIKVNPNIKKLDTQRSPTDASWLIIDVYGQNISIKA